MGSESYVKKAVNDEKYEDTTDVFVTNSENSNLSEEYDNVDISIDVDGVRSYEMSEDLAKFISDNPDICGFALNVSATGAEIASGGVQGAKIATFIFNCFSQMSRRCRLQSLFLSRSMIDLRNIA